MLNITHKWEPFEVFANGKPLEIYSVQPLTMQNRDDNMGNDICYLLQVEMPQDIYGCNAPHEIRVVGHNSQYNEYGESVYYLETPKYNWKK